MTEEYGRVKVSLAQARILWWMKNIGEFPSATMCTVHSDGGSRRVPNTFRWGGMTISYLSEVGLCAPRLGQKITRAMITAGLCEVEPERLPDNVIAFPRKDWDHATRYHQAKLRQQREGTMVRPTVRLLPTEKGLALAPEMPPFPWVPAMNKRSDVVRSEEQRQANIAHARRVAEAWAARAAQAGVTSASTTHTITQRNLSS